MIRALVDCAVNAEKRGYQRALADVIAHLRDDTLWAAPTPQHIADWIERELGGRE